MTRKLFFHRAAEVCSGIAKKYPEEGEQVLFLRGHKWSGPSGHPSGPLGVCNPNEKQKPPPLPVRLLRHVCHGLARCAQVHYVRDSHSHSHIFLHRQADVEMTR